MLNSEYNSSFFPFFFLCIHPSNVEKQNKSKPYPLQTCVQRTWPKLTYLSKNKTKQKTSIDYPDTGFLHIKATDSTVQIKIHSIFFMMLEDTNCIH